MSQKPWNLVSGNKTARCKLYYLIFIFYSLKQKQQNETGNLRLFYITLKVNPQVNQDLISDLLVSKAATNSIISHNLEKLNSGSLNIEDIKPYLFLI